jgi:hypothetical protein
VVTGENSVQNQLSFWRIDLEKGTADFINGVGEQGQALAHNVFIDKNFVYSAHYAQGAMVFNLRDVDASKKMEPFWAYDTYPDNNLGTAGPGVWGVYPFVGKDHRLFFATDGKYGLHAFRKTDAFMSKVK